MKKVALAKCSNYEIANVDKAVKDLLNNLGGLEQFVKPGMKVLIKPNLVMKKAPEEAATTHPSIVESISKMLIELGAEITIADSPGGYYNEKILESVYKACGYKDLAERINVRLNYNTSFIEKRCENGLVAKSFTFIKPVEDADLIINVSKLKTHVMMVLTGAVKNLFGLIPGALKAEYHLKMNSYENFSNLLVDICECVKPQISIVDAVEAMEGDGPTAGKPHHIGVLIGGFNPYAIDIIAADIIGLKVNQVYTIQRSIERKLIGDIADIKLVGDDIEMFRAKDFCLPDIQKELTFFNNKVFKFLVDYLKPRPIFDKKKCVRCKICGNHCPPRAIEFRESNPEVDLKKCIRCFCCQELCPQKAISIKKRWISTKILR